MRDVWKSALEWYIYYTDRTKKAKYAIVIMGVKDRLTHITNEGDLSRHYMNTDGLCEGVVRDLLPNEHWLDVRRTEDIAYGLRCLELSTGKRFDLMRQVREMLADVLPGADVFLGLSAPRVLKPEWLATMGPKPLILALANPDPEIRPEDAKRVRPDAILATMLMQIAVSTRMMAYVVAVDKPTSLGLKLDLDGFRRDIEESLREMKKRAEAFILQATETIAAAGREEAEKK